MMYVEGGFAENEKRLSVSDAEDLRVLGTVNNGLCGGCVRRIKSVSVFPMKRICPACGEARLIMLWRVRVRRIKSV